MKTLFLAFLLLLPGGMLFCQLVPPAHINSSVVYFVKSSNIGNNIHLYDSTEYIGELDPHTYLRYECKSGRHLFWARGENTDFVIADLATGRQYFILVLPDKSAPGGIIVKPYIDLLPVYPDNQQKVNTAVAFINSQASEKFSDEELAQEQKKQKKKIKKHLLRYQEDRYRGKLYSRLTKNMYYR